MRNLLSNAIRHAEHQVTIPLSESGTRITLTGIDDRPDIADETVDRIFERFGRADEARSSNGGSGLGHHPRHRRSTQERDIGPTEGARFIVELRTS